MKIHLEKIQTNDTFRGKSSDFVDSGFVKTYDELVIGLHRPPKTNRSHSFHATSSKHLYSSDNVVISSAEEDSDHEVGMDCERDSLNPSLKDASSLQGYIYIRICSYSF